MVAALVLLSLALATIYLREAEGGALHEAQRLGSEVLTPLEVAGERVARPFRDAYNYVDGLADARSEAEQLREELEQLRRQVVTNQTAAADAARYERILLYQSGPTFPDEFDSVVARVTQVPSSPFRQEIVIAAGTNTGVGVNDTVVTPDGLVGRVIRVSATRAKIRLLTDQQSAVSAIVVGSGARGVTRAASSAGAGLTLDRVEKEEVVEAGDIVITSGFQVGELESLFPAQITIGAVRSVGQQDIDLFKRIQIESTVDFESLTEVIVLVPKQ